ncbi:single-stranded DNA-binding protein [Streptomyces sp. NPDC056061]|uniref:single-stranded DNA-binding protein n=1 Tax=Streptomyces sp. NPDC056061 TaxID=3345700 RepID=UPI0035E15923
MSNPRNNGNLLGRLANDPKVFKNRDGSKKVMFTVFADRNFTNAAGERQSDAIPVEAFVRATTPGTGPFDNIHKGDLVALSTSLRMDHYTKNGSEVFDVKVVVEGITFVEPRSVTQARLSERVRDAEAQNRALHAQAPAAVASAVQDEQFPFG